MLLDYWCCSNVITTNLWLDDWLRLMTCLSFAAAICQWGVCPESAVCLTFPVAARSHFFFSCYSVPRYEHNFFVPERACIEQSSPEWLIYVHIWKYTRWWGAHGSYMYTLSIKKNKKTFLYEKCSVLLKSVCKNKQVCTCIKNIFNYVP